MAVVANDIRLGLLSTKFSSSTVTLSLLSSNRDWTNDVLTTVWLLWSICLLVLSSSSTKIVCISDFL